MEAGIRQPHKHHNAREGQGTWKAQGRGQRGAGCILPTARASHCRAVVWSATLDPSHV